MGSLNDVIVSISAPAQLKAHKSAIPDKRSHFGVGTAKSQLFDLGKMSADLGVLVIIYNLHSTVTLL